MGSTREWGAPRYNGYAGWTTPTHESGIVGDLPTYDAVLSSMEDAALNDFERGERLARMRRSGYLGESDTGNATRMRMATLRETADDPAMTPERAMTILRDALHGSHDNLTLASETLAGMAAGQGQGEGNP